MSSSNKRSSSPSSSAAVTTKRARPSTPPSPPSTAPVVLGQHTLVPTLMADASLYADTILASNHGRLPPYLIVVGDRTRVTAIATQMDECTALHDHMLLHGASPKRVSVVVGTYKGTPVVVAEHGMGCSSTDIIVRELLSDVCMRTRFVTTNATDEYVADAKYVVRVGSSAGINDHKSAAAADSAECVRAFDLVVTDEQVGVSGTDVQGLTGALNWLASGDDTRNRATTKLTELGFSIRDEWACIRADATLSQCLAAHARRVVDGAFGVHVGGNISKDSLYAEADEEKFTCLRTSHNVKSSEMEFSTLSLIQQLHNVANDPVKAGMVLFVLGTIPGNSFEVDAVKIARARDASATAALEALHEISLKHKRARQRQA